MNRPTDPIIQRMMDMLGDRDPRVRRNAIGTLQLNGRRALCAIPRLASLSEVDENPHVRREAAQAIECLKKVA